MKWTEQTVQKYPFLHSGTVWRDTFRRLSKMLQTNNASIILDVGCLGAPYTRHLANSVVAMDLPQKGRFGLATEDARKIERRKKNFSPVMASAELLPFRDESFDLIVCTEVLEHIYDDKLALSELSRVLRRTGKAFFTTPNGNAIPLEKGIAEHLRHYSEDSLRAILSERFEDIHVESRFFMLPFLDLQYMAGMWTKYVSKEWRNNHKLVSAVASLLPSLLYDIMYSIGKHIEPGKLNLVALASIPRRTNPN